MAETATNEAPAEEPRIFDGTDSLEFARSVYNVYRTQAESDDRPIQRIRKVAALMGMNESRVRRNIALHVAPAGIRDFFAEGRLAGRVVELLQGLSELSQIAVAKRVMHRNASTAAGVQTVNVALAAEGTTRGREWSDNAKCIEDDVTRAIELLDPYLDMPRSQLHDLFRQMGGGIGRRTLIALLDEHIEVLATLKQSLGMYREREDGKQGNGSATNTS